LADFFIYEDIGKRMIFPKDLLFPKIVMIVKNRTDIVFLYAP